LFTELVNKLAVKRRKTKTSDDILIYTVIHSFDSDKEQIQSKTGKLAIAHIQ